MSSGFDLAVVGAGIVGLSHALAAAKRGKRVVMLDRDSQANGASVRNFGFITVTGQKAGECWNRARRARDIWVDLAPKAGIEIVHQGLAMVARRPEGAAVLEAFSKTEMGEQCQLMTPMEAFARCPSLRTDTAKAVLWSPHELRVESATAIPKLAAYLQDTYAVEIHRGVTVHAVEDGTLETSAGSFETGATVVCPGDNYTGLFADRIAQFSLTRVLLHMMRVDTAPQIRLGCTIMSDLGLIRYHGYTDLPEVAALRAVIEQEQPDAIAHGIHLIAVQSSDGSLVVGDSHLYSDNPPDSDPADVDRLVTEEMQAVLNLPAWSVRERWTGTHAYASDRLALIDSPSESVRLVLVTSGTGASTGFAIGEEVIADLFD